MEQFVTLFLGRLWSIPLFQLECDSACYALLTPDVAAYIVVYVDDVLIFNTNNNWTLDFMSALSPEFDIKDLGAPVHVLGMLVVRDRERGTFKLHQGPYVRDLLQRFNMTDSK